MPPFLKKSIETNVFYTFKINCGGLFAFFDNDLTAYKDQKCRFYIKLGREPSTGQVTKSNSPRLPALERFYRETKFSP